MAAHRISRVAQGPYSGTGETLEAHTIYQSRPFRFPVCLGLMNSIRVN